MELRHLRAEKGCRAGEAPGLANTAWPSCAPDGMLHPIRHPRPGFPSPPKEARIAAEVRERPLKTTSFDEGAASQPGGSTQLVDWDVLHILTGLLLRIFLAQQW